MYVRAPVLLLPLLGLIVVYSATQAASFGRSQLEEDGMDEAQAVREKLLFQMPLDNLTDDTDTRWFHRLLLDLVDTALTHAREQGKSGAVIGRLEQKRSDIRKCFFHAVSCWK